MNLRMIYVVVMHQPIVHFGYYGFSPWFKKRSIHVPVAYCVSQIATHKEISMISQLKRRFSSPFELRFGQPQEHAQEPQPQSYELISSILQSLLVSLTKTLCRTYV